MKPGICLFRVVYAPMDLADIAAKDRTGAERAAFAFFVSPFAAIAMCLSSS